MDQQKIHNFTWIPLFIIGLGAVGLGLGWLWLSIMDRFEKLASYGYEVRESYYFGKGMIKDTIGLEIIYSVRDYSKSMHTSNYPRFNSSNKYNFKFRNS